MTKSCSQTRTHGKPHMTHVELLDVRSLGVLGGDDARADDLDRPRSAPVTASHLRVFSTPLHPGQPGIQGQASITFSLESLVGSAASAALRISSWHVQTELVVLITWASHFTITTKRIYYLLLQKLSALVARIICSPPCSTIQLCGASVERKTQAADFE